MGRPVPRGAHFTCLTKRRTEAGWKRAVRRTASWWRRWAWRWRMSRPCTSPPPCPPHLPPLRRHQAAPALAGGAARGRGRPVAHTPLPRRAAARGGAPTRHMAMGMAGREGVGGREGAVRARPVGRMKGEGPGDAA
ncbi:unnamed protein product [Closterium sp. Naga37s-1]|nr:unnamed protein product [Closterium sp. Naga37s-1]